MDFLESFCFRVLLHNVSEQSCSWICRQTDETFVLYVHTYNWFKIGTSGDHICITGDIKLGDIFSRGVHNKHTYAEFPKLNLKVSFTFLLFMCVTALYQKVHMFHFSRRAGEAIMRVCWNKHPINIFRTNLNQEKFPKLKHL